MRQVIQVQSEHRGEKLAVDLMAIVAVQLGNDRAYIHTTGGPITVEFDTARKVQQAWEKLPPAP